MNVEQVTVKTSIINVEKCGAGDKVLRSPVQSGPFD